VGTNAAFTASRTWTLPAASAVNPGQEIVVADFQGTVTGTNTLVISRAGSDTVNGGTSVTISAANGAYMLKSDGVSKWTAQALGAAAAGGVSSVTCGTGLSGGTITTSGACALSPIYMSVSLISAPQTISGITKITFDTVTSNVGGYWDSTNHWFKPLVAGTYNLCTSVRVTGTVAQSGGIEIDISKGGTMGSGGVSVWGWVYNTPAGGG